MRPEPANRALTLESGNGKGNGSRKLENFLKCSEVAWGQNCFTLGAQGVISAVIETRDLRIEGLTTCARLCRQM